MSSHPKPTDNLTYNTFMEAMGFVWSDYTGKWEMYSTTTCSRVSIQHGTDPKRVVELYTAKKKEEHNIIFAANARDAFFSIMGLQTVDIPNPNSEYSNLAEYVVSVERY